MTSGTIRIDERRLEIAMARQGFTIGDVAQRMGVHYNTVLRIKKEGTTNLGTLGELCNALECHPFDVLVAVDYPETFYLAPASH